MDLWNLFFRRAFGVSSLYWLLGRWVRHLPGGTLRHAKIAAAPAKPLECAVGWVVHTSRLPSGVLPTGIALSTALLVVLAGCKSTARKAGLEAADRSPDTLYAGRTSGAAADSAAIARAHEQWIRAFQRHDPTLIEPLLAEEIVYHGVEPFTKQHLLGHVRDTSFALETVSPTELRVRVFGSARDVAVVTGSVNARGRREGKLFNLQNRYTEVWVKRGGRWQCVAGQETTWPANGRT